MNDRYSISRAADHLGVSPSILRRWEACGKLVPERTAGGQRRYRANQLMTQQDSTGTEQIRSWLYGSLQSGFQP